MINCGLRCYQRPQLSQQSQLKTDRVHRLSGPGKTGKRRDEGSGENGGKDGKVEKQRGMERRLRERGRRQTRGKLPDITRDKK